MVEGPVLRNIASQMIDEILPGLAPDRRRDYVTAITRQWITNECHAGVFTVAANYWLILEEREGQILALRDVVVSDLPQNLLDLGIARTELPDLLHQLTLAQSATITNEVGVTVKVRAIPKERRFESGKDE